MHRNLSMTHLEQQTNIKFCQKLGKIATKTYMGGQGGRKQMKRTAKNRLGWLHAKNSEQERKDLKGS